MPVQLPLGIRLRDDATLTSYYPGPNETALDVLKGFVVPDSPEFLVYLWGAQGAGKTHLLQGACHAVAAFNKSALYIPLSACLFHGPELLRGLDQVSLVCLDDLHAIRGDKDWQQAVFHLFNRLKEAKGHLLIAAEPPPNQLQFELPDLVSRLSWGLTFQLKTLGDDSKLQALQLRAKARGIDLADDAGWFLLRRYARDMHQLYEILEKLDEASLVHQRRLTIPFIKSILSL